MSKAGVVLAAGLGTRMKSSLPKVLHLLNGTPLLRYIVNTLYELRLQKIIVVTGERQKEIKESLTDTGRVSFVRQKDARGTADALSAAISSLRGFKGTILVVNGDTPLITGETLKRFLKKHKRNRNDISVLSFIAKEQNSYGRILRDRGGRIISIIEDRNATTSEKIIKEVNSGVYAIEHGSLHFLKEIKPNKGKGEYYLTDIVEIALNKGKKVESYCIGSEEEFMGINTRKELEKAGQLMRQRIVERFMNTGVSFIDAGSVFISTDTEIGKETLIYPNVHLEGRTKIGKGCIIYPNVRLLDTLIGDSVVIKDCTLIESSVVNDRASIGPFAHIRPESKIDAGVRIGNFVEVKKSVIGSGTKAMHLTYLGDAVIGKDVNIGAGTITCNYDGYTKHTTAIEDNVFIGSDSQLIAPVTIGKGAYVGAGSTITKNVPQKALALSRAEQKILEGWAIRKKSKAKSQKLKEKKKKQR